MKLSVGDGRTAAPPARAIILDAADGGLAFARALVRRGVPVTVIAISANRWVT
jgi:hypothetical protein